MCRLPDSDKGRKVSEYGQHSFGALKRKGREFPPTLLFTDIKKKQKHKKEKNISLRGWESIGIHDVCSELSGK